MTYAVYFRNIPQAAVRRQMSSRLYGYDEPGKLSPPASATNKSYWSSIYDRVDRMKCRNLTEMCVESDIRAAAAERSKWNSAVGGGLALGLTVAASFFGGGLTLLAAAAATACLARAAYHQGQQRNWRHTQLELERVGHQMLKETPGYVARPSEPNSSPTPPVVKSLRTALGVAGDDGKVTRLKMPQLPRRDGQRVFGQGAEVVQLRKEGPTTAGERSPR